MNESEYRKAVLKLWAPRLLVLIFITLFVLEYLQRASVIPPIW